MTDFVPNLSVVIPTYNNEAHSRRCLTSWQLTAAACRVEIIVIEDGCRDGTRAFLESESHSAWGQRHLRWIHLDDAHELRCTNAGMAAARAPLMMAWQDDMFVTAEWLVSELLANFRVHEDIGLMSLSRGLDYYPLDEPIVRWEDLVDWRRLRSTIGPAPGNWFRVQEVDAVWLGDLAAIRPGASLRVGMLDEAFVPTEWDEADLARIREAGWKVATCGYERLGGYEHLGSSALGS
jgi:GT2 family glycosyltransferase